MSYNINSIINDYLNSKGQYTKEEIIEAIKNITPEYNASSTSIFEIDDDGLTIDEFREALSGVAGKDVSESADILFDVLNTDDDKDSLSLDELGNLVETKNGKNRIENFSVWNTFYSIAKRGDISVPASSTADSDTTTSTDTSSTSGTTGSSSGATKLDPKKDVNKEAQKWCDKINKLINESKSDDKKTPEYYIQYFLDNDLITEEIADQVRSYFVTYSDEDEAKINDYLKLMQEVDPDATRLDAIEELKNRGEIGDPVADSNSALKDIEEERKIPPKTTVDAEKYAKRLYRAFHPSGLFDCTDEQALKDILGENSKFTSADIVAIAQAFNNNKKYYDDEGSLIRTIDKETSGKDLDEIAGGYAKHLIQAAKDGVPGAIELIATELYEAGENRCGCTCEQFIDVILDDEIGLPDDLLAQVRDYYDSQYDPGLADAMYDEYSGTKADKYEFKIENAGEE